MMILIIALLLTKAGVLRFCYTFIFKVQNKFGLQMVTRIFIKSGKAIKYKSNKTTVTTFIEWPRVK